MLFLHGGVKDEFSQYLIEIWNFVLCTPPMVDNYYAHVANWNAGVSLGVRVMIFDTDGAVFLVKHSYIKGWYFPGGGVDRGEVLVEAAKREMREEARIIACSEPPSFMGGYFSITS